ncbi:MAG: helix-turn-helix transcriptional regulator, partial [Anaerolineae bacterium]|nr:helix-turn-helix transcriptional regulator [Anaerolineae bacterium]
AGDLVTRPFDLSELLRRIDHLLKPVEIPTATLTERQHEILTLIARGIPDQEIARLLDVSVQTIRWHIKGASRRLEAKNRNHLIAIAVSRGLVKLD